MLGLQPRRSKARVQVLLFWYSASCAQAHLVDISEILVLDRYWTNNGLLTQLPYVRGQFESFGCVILPKGSKGPLKPRYVRSVKKDQDAHRPLDLNI